jgi:hypothetical protein
MPPSFDHLLKQAQDWAERAADDDWLAPADIHALTELENRSPASLFEAGAHRPLVAAFFGGTGVGKSTLLNRLAGQPIARTGIERPTSREVSVYLHESVHLRKLPPHFPMERVRIAHHHDERRRAVLWIDMPDIDSIEQHNREVVLDWLPHIDVLIYVVSPERYRDDKGWRLLQTHGGEHAWLFVINQWDRGHPAQYEDFGKLLIKGGFENPILLRTDSRPAGTPKPDDFERLKATLQDMADRHVIEQLELRAESLRLEALRDAVSGCLEKLGDGRGYGGLKATWDDLWEETRADLAKGLEWPIQSVARAFVGHEANPLLKPIDLTRKMAPPNDARETPPPPRSILWDEWAESRVRDALNLLVVEAGQKGLPARPLKAALDSLGHDVGTWVLDEGQRSLRLALANPGNTLQRFCLKLSGVLAVLLPLAAIGWVSYQVVKGYYEGALHQAAYLGTDFAIHSGLLIALSWLLPYFAYRTLRPSAEKTAIRGLRAGIGLALERVGERVGERLAETETRREAVREEGQGIAERAAPMAEPRAHRAGSLLERVLPAGKPRS